MRVRLEDEIDLSGASVTALIERLPRIDLAFELRTPVRIVSNYLVDGPLDPVSNEYLF
jgi:hypothetical protein